MSKYRLDALLYSKGIAASREKARAMIIAGEVIVNGNPNAKPGTQVDENVELVIKPIRMKYVSRGGFKLEGAINDFGVDFSNKTVIDVGASTGGYTDCALKNGAARVYAIDVGYGQLDWSLRNDPRVKVMEKTNVRYLAFENIGEKVDMVTMDVSFISTTLIFPVLKKLIKDDGEIISLIKPQFEAGKDKVGKKGVVKDPRVHEQVLNKCVSAAASQGLNCIGITYSPITGPQGNIEFFIRLKQDTGSLDNIEALIEDVVTRAHSLLEGKAR